MSTANPNLGNEYDAVLYPASPHPKTHPERLAVIGGLWGLRPKPVTGCRVLELGCGDGSNLLPMGATLPQSEFVGVDLAGVPVSHGQKMISELGLGNVRLVHGSVTEVDSSWGQFDYIIAHGIYSWVPDNVRESILAVCQARLNPQGIAFVSYNALPGGHGRNMVRELLHFHLRGFEKADERITQAMAFASFMAKGILREDPIRAYLADEFDEVLRHERGHLYHDELAEVNDAFYLVQFMERAARHGLQYLGEADYFETQAHGYDESVWKILDQLSSRRVLREQYLDFLKARRFRQTLLCHEDLKLRSKASADPIKEFLVTSTARCAMDPPDLKPGVRLKYSAEKNARCETDYAVGKAALQILTAASPIPVLARDLHQQAVALLGQQKIQVDVAEETLERFCDFLLALYGAGVVEFHTFVPRQAREPGPFPVVPRLARWQAAHGQVVTTLNHFPTRVEDEIGLLLLRSLDGTLDREAILDRIWQMLKSRNALRCAKGGEAEARRELARQLEDNLAKLAQLGLLEK